MSATHKPGTVLNLKISKAINRESAAKTIERLFMQDNAVRAPIDAREANFVAIPKRRGGRIWTKRPNKTHPLLVVGKAAKVISTPQTLKDLASVSDFVTVSA
jgi:hypothetical protein